MKIGDFVTQYSVGYWQLIDLKPKYAEEGELDADGRTCRKGELIGQFAVLKKAFTPKMKPRIMVEFADIAWVKPVGDGVLRDIEQYFLDHPEYKERFDHYPGKPEPAITNCWFNLPEEEETAFRELLDSLPQQFTMADFWKKLENYKAFIIANPPTRYLLNFLCYPWDVDEEGNSVYIGCELLKL